MMTSQKCSAARAQQRVLETRLNGELVRRGWEPVSDPVAWYMDVAGEVRAFLELARERVAQLNRLEHVDASGAESVKAVLGMYERALDRAQRTADAMTSRGIEAKAARNVELTAEANIAALRQLIGWARAEDTAADDLIIRLITDDLL